MTNYLLGKDAASCYGCRACMQICTKGAISLQPDEEGFLYPSLDESKCIGCGACVRVCPYDTPSQVNQPQEVFAAAYTDEKKLLESSSGGLFSAFADHVLSQGGLVAGCLFDEHLRAVHVLTDEDSLVAAMRGSKYVQSDTGRVYSEIKSALAQKRTVLFCGTPCQVDGLKRFLGGKEDGLFTVDLICHGVPSPLLLENYLEQQQKKLGKITGLRFRDKKRHGWTSQGTLCGQSGRRSISPFNDSYYQLFYFKNCVSRMTCYSCKYACTDRVADLTIGDYWGIDRIPTSLDIKKGVSALFVNTSKGEMLLDAVKDRLHLQQTSLEEAVRANGNLSSSGTLPKERKTIYAEIEKEGYDAAVKKHCRYRYVLPFIRKHTPESVKKLLKKILR